MKSANRPVSIRNPAKRNGPPVSRRVLGLGAGLVALGLLLAGLSLVHGTSLLRLQRSSDVSPTLPPDVGTWLLAYSAYDGPAAESLIAAPSPRTGAKPVQRLYEILPPDAVLKLPAAPHDLRKLINEVAAEVKIAPALLHAVIATESRYNSDALSPRGAIGLMQLMPETALRFGAPDPYNPRDNVLAGANYLKFLLKLFGNDMELVLAAYNAGHNAVLRAGNRIPEYPETQAYVPKVMAYMRCASSAACRPA
jgi:soluble lytic murein transglycosylase-like protein